VGHPLTASRSAMRDIISGVIFTALSLWAYLEARTFPKPPGQPGPGIFPQILAVLLMGASVVLTASGVRKRAPITFNWRKSFKKLLSPSARNFFGVVVLVLVYLFLSPHMGFFLSAALILFVLMIQLKVHPMLALAVAVVTAAVARFLFQNFLKIPLPPGPFPGGW